MGRNPLTFNDIDPTQADYPTSTAPYHSSQYGFPSTVNAAEVHNAGEVWCVTLWEARAALIGRYGWAVGNQLILQLVTDGLKLSPANPNYVQARDAILQADVVDNGGTNAPLLWAAFAKRGLGYGATAPVSTKNTNVLESFDLPGSLQLWPLAGFASRGNAGGPFSVVSQTLTLTNSGASSLNWSATASAGWLNVSPAGGTLVSGQTIPVTISLNAMSSNLAAGTYSATVSFTNLGSNLAQFRQYALTVAALASGGYASNIMATAPAYWWRLDETGVTPPHMMATNRGSVGPAANGLVTGLTPNKTGCIRDSFWFDNFMSDAYFSGNRVDVPLQPAFSNAGPFTIELWAKNYYYLRYYGSGFAVSCWSVTNAAVFQAGGWCLLQSFSQVGTSFYHNWTFRVSTAIPWGTKTFAYYDITSPALETNSPQTQWTHVAGVYDGTNIFLYLNGQRCTTSIYSNGVAMPGAISTPGWFSPPFQGFRIGAGFDFVTNNYIWSICRGYNGRLDEVAYYANALSSNTIFSHYAAATTNVSGYGAQIIADGAVGYWPFDDSAPDPGTLPVATNSGTLSPRATGLITPGCTPGVAGVPHPTFGADNRACLFDGNAYIDCGTNDLVRSNSITVSAWAKPDATTNGDWEGIVSSGFYLFWLAMDSAGHARFAYGNMVNSGWKPLDSGVRIDDGQWHHLVGVFDGAGVALYVDGQLTASTNSISIVGSYRYNILIGAHPGDFLVSGSPNCSEAIQGRPFYYSYGSAYSTYGSPLTMMNWTGFRGAIDDVVIWTNALTGAQIQQLYSSATNAVVQTTPVFQPPTRSGNTLFLNWSAISGRSYQVQYKTNLTQSNWGTLTTLTATNATVSFPDDMTADRQRFYRVVLMP